jgi:hypothetical protein
MMKRLGLSKEPLHGDELIRFPKLFAHRFRAAKESEGDIEIALREALANSVVHGNRYCAWPLAFSCSCFLWWSFNARDSTFSLW